MREIKFRAWDGAIMLDSGFSINPHGHAYNIREEHSPHFKLMQYTGIKDKNGVEIYEGDILNCVDDHGLTSIEKVEYSEYGFEPFTNQTGDLADCYSEFNYDSFEVIGNIYENPELL